MFWTTRKPHPPRSHHEVVLPKMTPYVRTETTRPTHSDRTAVCAQGDRAALAHRGHVQGDPHCVTRSPHNPPRMHRDGDGNHSALACMHCAVREPCHAHRAACEPHDHDAPCAHCTTVHAHDDRICMYGDCTARACVCRATSITLLV